MSRYLTPYPDMIDNIQIDRHHPEMVKRQYEVQLITPLYGGGVKVGKSDPLTLIRSTSIRGNLRFWWRATRGACFTNAVSLKKREDEVWGSTTNPSPVQVEVKVIHNAGKRESDSCFGFGEYGPEAYALFSAMQDKSGESELVREGTTFLLTVRWYTEERLQRIRDLENRQRRKEGKKPLGVYQDIQKDVEVALWAWINFGGIGARTRRGLGAIYCLNPSKDKELHPPNLKGFNVWLKKKYKQFGIPKSADTPNWPLLPFEFFVGSKSNNTLAAWQFALSSLRDFRQGRNVGRDPGRGMAPGRSRWPEAESIRELVMHQKGFTNRSSCSLKTKDKRIPPRYFPRAEFGLPIIFELRGEGIDGLDCEGKNIKPMLVPSKNTERMASPLILRPIRFQDGFSAALACFLKTSSLDEARLRPGECDLERAENIDSDHIRSTKLATYSDSPMGPGPEGKLRSASGSALDAFKSFIEEKGFKRVVI